MPHHHHHHHHQHHLALLVDRSENGGRRRLLRTGSVALDPVARTITFLPRRRPGLLPPPPSPSTADADERRHDDDDDDHDDDDDDENNIRENNPPEHIVVHLASLPQTDIVVRWRTIHFGTPGPAFFIPRLPNLRAVADFAHSVCLQPDDLIGDINSNVNTITRSNNKKDCDNNDIRNDTSSSNNNNNDTSSNNNNIDTSNDTGSSSRNNNVTSNSNNSNRWIPSNVKHIHQKEHKEEEEEEGIDIEDDDGKANAPPASIHGEPDEPCQPVVHRTISLGFAATLVATGRRWKREPSTRTLKKHSLGLRQSRRLPRPPPPSPTPDPVFAADQDFERRSTDTRLFPFPRPQLRSFNSGSLSRTISRWANDRRQPARHNDCGSILPTPAPLQNEEARLPQSDPKSSGPAEKVDNTLLDMGDHASHPIQPAQASAHVESVLLSQSHEGTNPPRAASEKNNGDRLVQLPSEQTPAESNVEMPSSSPHRESSKRQRQNGLYSPVGSSSKIVAIRKLGKMDGLLVAFSSILLLFLTAFIVLLAHVRRHVLIAENLAAVIPTSIQCID